MGELEREWSNLDEDVRLLTNLLDDASDKLKEARAQFKAIRSRLDDLYQKIKETDERRIE